MLTQKELVRTPEYWQEKIQNDLYQEVMMYLNANKMNRADLAKEWNVSKGYVSQVMNGNFNFTMSKLIELALNMNLAPVLELQPMAAWGYEMTIYSDHVEKIKLADEGSCKVVSIKNGMQINSVMDYSRVKQ